MSMEGPERGAKPQYFEEPALDGLYQMVLVLAEELALLRERVDCLLAIQADGQPATKEQVDATDLGEEYDACRQRFVQRLLEPLEDLARQE